MHLPLRTFSGRILLKYGDRVVQDVRLLGSDFASADHGNRAFSVTGLIHQTVNRVLNQRAAAS